MSGKNNRVILVVMAVISIFALGFIGRALYLGNDSQGKIIINDMSGIDIDPLMNLDKYPYKPGEDQEAIEIVTNIDDGEIYGYTSEKEIIIPDELRNVQKSRISIVSVYIAKKDEHYMAAYKINSSYYYYVSKDVDEEEFLDFLRGNFQ